MKIVVCLLSKHRREVVRLHVCCLHVYFLVLSLGCTLTSPRWKVTCGWQPSCLLTELLHNKMEVAGLHVTYCFRSLWFLPSPGFSGPVCKCRMVRRLPKAASTIHRQPHVFLLLFPYAFKWQTRRAWWRTPLIPALGRQRQADFWVRGQPGLQSEFQDSQGYTEKPCLEKTKNK